MSKWDVENVRHVDGIGDVFTRARAALLRPCAANHHAAHDAGVHVPLLGVIAFQTEQRCPAAPGMCREREAHQRSVNHDVNLPRFQPHRAWQHVELPPHVQLTP